MLLFCSLTLYKVAGHLKSHPGAPWLLSLAPWPSKGLSHAGHIRSEVRLKYQVQAFILEKGELRPEVKQLPMEGDGTKLVPVDPWCPRAPDTSFTKTSPLIRQCCFLRLLGRGRQLIFLYFPTCQDNLTKSSIKYNCPRNHLPTPQFPFSLLQHLGQQTSSLALPNTFSRLDSPVEARGIIVLASRLTGFPKSQKETVFKFQSSIPHLKSVAVPLFQVIWISIEFPW